MKEVAKAYQKVANETKLYTEEGMRKRFKLANQAIFKATGVYFTGSGLGLVKYGVPNDSEIPRLMREAIAAQPSAGAAKTMNASRKRKQRSGGEKSSKAKVVDSDKCADDDGDSDVDTITFVLQLPDGRCHATRHISREIFQSLRINADQMIPCTTETFDRWYSCVCLGLRHTLPKRIHKLNEVPGGSVLVDQGIFETTFQTLLDVYCLSQMMGTTVVSDMILNEINRSLKDEKRFYTHYGGLGKICEVNCDYIVRLLDLEPADIERLWETTLPGDPIRTLFIDLFTHNLEGTERCEEVVMQGLHSASHAAELYSTFARDHRQNGIESFISADYQEMFCAKYHNHSNEEACALSIPYAEFWSKVLEDKLDIGDTNSIYQLDTDRVNGCKIINKTGGSLDIVALYNRKPGWDWERVKSINSFVYIPPRGCQFREPQPVYFKDDEKDVNGRYPSHPGFECPDWKPLDGDDGYKKGDWNRARHFDIPDEAQKVREDEETNELLFEIEDQDWIPPSSFAQDVKRTQGNSFHEYQAYRRWLWIQRGNKIPLMTCKRWRPFNEPEIYWKDPFTDAAEGC
jgi:hypothetical protein